MTLCFSLFNPVVVDVFVWVLLDGMEGSRVRVSRASFFALNNWVHVHVAHESDHDR